MAGRLEGKVAVVNGAGTRGDGIGNGKACAIVYAREGAMVVAADIDAEAASATAAMIRAEGRGGAGNLNTAMSGNSAL